MGDVLIAPLICVWASPMRWSRRPLRWLECGLLVAALALVSTLVFRRPTNMRAIELVRGTYALTPLLIWAALRFEQRGTTAALLLVSVIAVSATASAGSYFAARTPHERLLMTDCYMAVTTISMLMLAAALAERRAAIGVRDEFISIASHELEDTADGAEATVGGRDPNPATAGAARHGRRRRSWGARWPPPARRRTGWSAWSTTCWTRHA